MGQFIHCNHIWDEEGLTFYAKGIYCLLAKFADKEGRCWPSLNTLKDHSGISKPTIIKAIAELKSRGYVQIDKRKTVNGDFDHNVYVLPGINRVVNHVDSNYIHNNYSIELLGEKAVFDNLIELYKQYNPKAVKRFKVGGIAKARDIFQEAINRKGVAPELLAEAIANNPEIPPWDIVKAVPPPERQLTDDEVYMQNLIKEIYPNGIPDDY